MNDSLPDYSYQVPLVAKVLAHLEKGRGVVLAATPGAGKTNMAINVITKLATPGKRVLVLTHGQNILKDQFFNRLKEVGAPFTFGVLSRTTVPDVQVHVALPQWAGFRKGRAPKYDYIVIDEAHHWFTAPSEQAILAQNPKAKLLLLTGTPSRFVKSKEFPIEFITIQELLEYNVLTDPYIEIVQTNLPMTLRDYNMQSGELLNDTEFTPQHIAAAMDAVLDALLKRLKSRARDPKLHHSWLKKGLEWNAILGSLEKTMVIAHDQDQARKIKDYFNKAGVEVALSTSDDDADSTQVANFTAKPDVSVLIVVRRGILGFDFKQLQNIIDLSCSMSPDTNFQALCRVVRKHGDARKLYLKVTPIYMAPAIHHALAFTVALSMPDLFKSYDGDWKTVPVPKLKKPRTGEGEGDGPDGAEDDGKPNKKPKVPWPAMLPELLTFNELKHLDRTKDVSSIAYTTFNDVRELFYGQRVVTDEETNWKRLEAYLKRQAEAGRQIPRQMLRPHEGRSLQVKPFTQAQAMLFQRKMSRKDPERLTALRASFGLPPFVVETRIRWTEERIQGLLIEAKKYKTRRDWSKYGGGGYHAARARGKEFLEKCCVHMKPLPVRWTEEATLADAKKYQVRTEWYAASAGAYGSARKRGKEFFAKCCAHMPVLLRPEWTDKELLADAKKYKSKTAWYDGSSGACSAAYKRGKEFLEKCCAHMKARKQVGERDAAGRFAA